MNIQTSVRKNHYGNWEVEATIMLDSSKELSIYTAKRSSGSISTSASVGYREGNCVSHVMFQDFSKILQIEKFRATEKSVRAFHEKVNIEEVIAEATAFYAAKGELK